LEELDVLGEWGTTGGYNPKPFLLHDTGVDARGHRVIVFASEDQLRHLSKSEIWYIDGNFKCAPTLFAQMFVIRAGLVDAAVTCAYAFLTGI